MNLFNRVLSAAFSLLTGAPGAYGADKNFYNPSKSGINKKFLDSLRGLNPDLAKEYVELKGWSATFVAEGAPINITKPSREVYLWIENGVVGSATTGN